MNRDKFSFSCGQYYLKHKRRNADKFYFTSFSPPFDRARTVESPIDLSCLWSDFSLVHVLV